MALKDEILALIPSDMEDAEKAEVRKIIEEAFAEEAVVPGEEIQTDKIKGV